MKYKTLIHDYTDNTKLELLFTLDILYTPTEDSVLWIDHLKYVIYYIGDEFDTEKNELVRYIRIIKKH